MELKFLISLNLESLTILEGKILHSLIFCLVATPYIYSLICLLSPFNDTTKLFPSSSLGILVFDTSKIVGKTSTRVNNV